MDEISNLIENATEAMSDMRLETAMALAALAQAVAMKEILNELENIRLELEIAAGKQY